MNPGVTKEMVQTAELRYGAIRLARTVPFDSLLGPLAHRAR